MLRAVKEERGERVALGGIIMLTKEVSLFLRSAALSGKILLVRIVENDNIYTYFRAG